MNYHESFEENKNPLVFKGVTGRLVFFATGFGYSLLLCGLIWMLCPKTLSLLANPMMSEGKAPLEVILSHSSTNEAVIYIGLTTIFMCLYFIIYKKRILDILGNTKNALPASVLIALVLFIMNLQSNFFAVTNSLQGVVLSVGFLFINLFLYFKKGKITGQKINKESK